jgi:uncharacterized damage-inducible protein DinB
MTNNFLKELFTHMEWADSEVWKAVLAADNGASDDSILESLLHIHLTQHAFLDVWNGRPFKFLKLEDFASAQELKLWTEQYYTRARNFLGSLDEAALSKRLDIPWAHYFEKKLGHPPFDVTLGESVFQVVAHSNYHRGQVNRRLREIGGEPPLVDYIVWLWMGRPEPGWDPES